VLPLQKLTISWKLYNYYALSDIRRIEPEGWRLSTRKDWESLFEYIGGIRLAGKKLKNNSSSWEEFGGDNDFNFSVLPGGFRSSEFFIKDQELQACMLQIKKMVCS